MVVDADVDVHDYAQVMWQVGANVDPARDVVLADGPLDHLDHAPTLQFSGGKIGIDATAKGPAEGYTRGWPEQIRMSAEVRDAVTSRWSEYGIGRPGRPAGEPPRRLRKRAVSHVLAAVAHDRYTPPGATVTIAARTTYEEDARWLMRRGASS